MRLTWSRHGWTSSRAGSPVDGRVSVGWIPQTAGNDAKGRFRVTESDSVAGVFGTIEIDPSQASASVSCLRFNPDAAASVHRAGVRDIALRVPTMEGLQTVEVVLSVRSPYAGQTTAYTVQACKWGAMEDSALAAFLDLGFDVREIRGTHVHLSWRNPSS